MVNLWLNGENSGGNGGCFGIEAKALTRQRVNRLLTNNSPVFKPDTQGNGWEMGKHFIYLYRG